MTSTARPSIPAFTTTSAAIPSFMAPRCSACVKPISARSPITAAFRRPGRFRTPTWNRTTAAPSALERRVYLGQDIPIGGTAHQNGTIRFGHDPRTSALDTNCKAHELDNLYVVDGSFFVSCGAVNPSLTIIANALRVGEHLRGILG